MFDLSPSFELASISRGDRQVFLLPSRATRPLLSCFPSFEDSELILILLFGFSDLQAGCFLGQVFLGFYAVHCYSGSGFSVP